ncbi:hypothetical protein VIBNISFn118_630010 [Vibrio nigripulchritudo SFn118]|nr:hypothetical protein VIBNISFn118_630010 [Vibrio nigripulchritudo SFn118]
MVGCLKEIDKKRRSKNQLKMIKFQSGTGGGVVSKTYIKM